ncbi:Uncharacterized protein DAT39_019634 [Clarias magur]|uniref:Uncharacterized protein n=1 Tax=Clarias magur TaxID=1594786 RepID=A0A8J4T757_CLAMG|nr:Uncharacterized protein DAT39_019634 [Clarias magur]
MDLFPSPDYPEFTESTALQQQHRHCAQLSLAAISVLFLLTYSNAHEKWLISSFYWISPS